MSIAETVASAKNALLDALLRNEGTPNADKLEMTASDLRAAAHGLEITAMRCEDFANALRRKKER